MVFDVKNDHFLRPRKTATAASDLHGKLQVRKGQRRGIYGVRHYVGERDNFTEVRTFRLEGYEFVTDETWLENEGSGYIPVVLSVCYV